MSTPSRRAGGDEVGGDGHRGRGCGLRITGPASSAAPSRETWVPNAPPSLSTHPRISREPPAAGARAEGRRQGSLGDPAPRSSPGGAVGERGWSVALEDRGGHNGCTHSSSRSPHRVPSWLSPESPPPTESGLGTRLCYEHSVDEPHGRAGKSDSLSPQENQT